MPKLSFLSLAHRFLLCRDKSLELTQRRVQEPNTQGSRHIKNCRNHQIPLFSLFARPIGVLPASTRLPSLLPRPASERSLLQALFARTHARPGHSAVLTPPRTQPTKTRHRDPIHGCTPNRRRLRNERATKKNTHTIKSTTQHTTAPYVSRRMERSVSSTRRGPSSWDDPRPGTPPRP